MKQFLTILFISIATLISAQDMTLDKMQAILEEEATEMDGTKGAWTLTYYEHVLLILTDEAANRMRIFSPIMEAAALKEGQVEQMLEANFHSALDAKYALYNGYVVSVYTHPLRELREEQFIDAMRQVVNLTITFGSTFSSTDLIFGSPDESPKVNVRPGGGKRN